MAAHAAGEAEHAEQVFHTGSVGTALRIDFRINAFKKNRGDHTGGAVARARQKDHVFATFTDDTVQVRVTKR